MSHASEFDARDRRAVVDADTVVLNAPKAGQRSAQEHLRRGDVHTAAALGAQQSAQNGIDRAATLIDATNEQPLWGAQGARASL